jgi:PAS domain S-box-containing protein
MAHGAGSQVRSPAPDSSGERVSTLELARNRWLPVAQIAALALAYFAAAWAGIVIGAHNEHATAVWPPSGIAVAVLVVGGKRLWPGVAVGAFAIEWFVGMPPLIAVGMAAGNTLATVTAVVLLERLRFRAALDGVRHVVWLILVAGAAMTVSATGGAALLELNGGVPGQTALGTWLVWWVGDLAGVMMVGPFALLLLSGRLHLELQGRRLEAVALMVLSAGGAWALWQSGAPIRQLALAFAIWGAMRFGPSGAAVSTLLISAAGISYLTGLPGSTPRDLVLVQGMSATIAIGSLCLAALLRERDIAVGRLSQMTTELEQRVEGRTHELVRSEQAARQSEDRLRALLNSAPDALVVVNAEGKIELTNDQTRDLLGYSPEELLGQSVDVLIPADRRDAHAQHRREYASTPKRRPMGEGRELCARHKDGTLVPVDVSLSPVELDDGLLVFAAMRDATARRATESAMRDALERERQASDHLRELDAARRSFLSGVSHELRTPLTAIIGYSDLLGDHLDGHDKTSIDMVARLKSNARRLSDLLGDLLDVDRLHRGIIEVRRSSVDVQQLVLRALEGVQTVGHYLEVVADKGFAMVDPAQALRIIENLVTNAVKYSPGQTTITLRARILPMNGLLLKVSDQGPGVPAALREAIFEPFYRAESESFVAGTGIGLSLVDCFAQLHGGRAWVAEAPGGGAAFHVSLPGPQAGGANETAEAEVA